MDGLAKTLSATVTQDPSQRMPRISVVIPVYNGARYVGEAISSALCQTRPPAEVVVVDDGSKDDSARIARLAGAHVVQQENRGPCAARNRGIASTSGDLLVFTDHDDRLLPEALEIGVAALEARPECGFVYGHSVTIDDEGRRLPPSTRRDVTRATYERMLAGDTLVPPGCAMFRRKLLEEVGGFLESIFVAEDYDLYLRISRKSPVYCHNFEVVEYRRHPTNLSRNATRQFRATMDTLERQRPFVAGDVALERALVEGRAHWGRVFAPGMAFEGVEAIRRGRLLTGAWILAQTLRADPASVAHMLRHFADRALAYMRG